MYAYAGFPRSLNGLNTFLQVLDSRREHGLSDTEGKAASPVSSSQSLRDRGTAVQTRLFGPVKGRLFDFAPAIDAYLKDHLFGDIFASDVLSDQDRELATIAALAAMQGTEGQLAAHSQAALRIGVPQQDIEEAIVLARSVTTPVSAPQDTTECNEEPL